MIYYYSFIPMLLCEILASFGLWGMWDVVTLSELWGCFTVIFGLVIVCPPSFAKVTSEVDIGLYNVKGDEIVYNGTSSRLSELFWNSKRVPVLGMHASWYPNNYHNILHIDVDSEFGMGGSSNMDDYDWIYSNLNNIKFNDWSDH